MRIVEVINSLSYRGGAQVFFCQLCAEMAKSHNEPIHIIVLYDRVDDSFNKIKNTENIIFHTVNKKRSFDLSAARKLKKLLKEIRPDIINFHLPFLSTYFLAFGLKKTNWKLIKTYHSIPNKDTNKFEIFLEKKYAKKGLLSFVGISKTISKIASQIHQNANIKTIYNGISLNNPEQKEYETKYDFVIVASFSKVKNHSLLFDAFEHYVELTKAKKMDEKVIFVGNQKNVFPFLHKSRTFVLTSLREGNPISILEAISVGLPVIAPNIGGIPDVIEDGINGYLYECNNHNQLLDAMIRINDSSTYQKIKSNNIKKASMFSIVHTASEYLDFFDVLCNKKE
jgi:glycosyltransferase involved in cell wall biosynthesis